jgi:hypothetical protein
MVVRAKRYGGADEFEDSDTIELDAEADRMTASRSGHGLAPILEPDDDYDDFDASEFVGRAYQ